MARIEVRLDRAGVAEVLKGRELARAMDDYAEAIAAQVRVGIAPGVDVVVDHYTTDRAAAAVTIAHRDGLALQAVGGALTRAAAALGLEVRAR